LAVYSGEVGGEVDTRSRMCHGGWEVWVHEVSAIIYVYIYIYIYLFIYINTKQLKWYGYVQRMEEGRLPKQTMKWSPPGRRK
jgi:hypothetical protein